MVDGSRYPRHIGNLGGFRITKIPKNDKRIPSRPLAGNRAGNSTDCTIHIPTSSGLCCEYRAGHRAEPDRSIPDLVQPVSGWLFI